MLVLSKEPVEININHVKPEAEADIKDKIEIIISDENNKKVDDFDTILVHAEIEEESFENDRLWDEKFAKESVCSFKQVTINLKRLLIAN